MKKQLANRHAELVTSKASRELVVTQGKKVEIIDRDSFVTVRLVSDKKRVEIVERSIASALATICLLESPRKEKKQKGIRYSLSDKVLEEAFANSFTSPIHI